LHSRCGPLWVNRVTLTARRLLPVYPQQRTSSKCARESVRCQGTKSLRSSPLRVSKSREAGSRSRGQRCRDSKVNTISSCIVGVQRMIKNSKGHLAGRHPDAASHIDPAITQCTSPRAGAASTIEIAINVRSYDPHSTRGTAGCHTSRDFVHWRFLDAGQLSLPSVSSLPWRTCTSDLEQAINERTAPMNPLPMLF
jgi:hypothetical protein